MPNSFATSAQLTCPACRQPFSADVWLVVDSSERPDLLEAARTGTLHSLPCPHCNHSGEVPAPLLLYRPELLEGGLSDTPLIFLPAADNPAEAEAEQARQLLGMLATSLGAAWRESWLRDAPGLPANKPALSASLLLDTLFTFINAVSWTESQQIVEANPQLLSNEADELLGELLDAQDDLQSHQLVNEHRILLLRCLEIGIPGAFIERRLNIIIPLQFASDFVAAEASSACRIRSCCWGWSKPI